MIDEVLDSPSADVDKSNTDRYTAQGSKRRMLNNASRGQRLQKRMESSIGSLESLDDRGLLEGGCSIPSTSSSLNRRNRRPLEMKNRSNRLKKRGKETVADALSHMIRILRQKGLRLEEFCSSSGSGSGSDPNEIGTMKKILFVRILRNIGLPFNANDLSDVLLRYSEPPDFNVINYHSFLGAVGVLASNEKEKNGTISEKREKNDWSQCIQVIFDVKRMFIETVENYKKIDDIYGMFSAWDSDATGTITSIQFLRVLERLHIVLTDQEEDFLVRLLDTNCKGRVEYENLLDFCFSGLDSVNQDSEQKSEKPLSIIIPNSTSDDANNDSPIVVENSAVCGSIKSQTSKGRLNNTNKKSKNNISGRTRSSSVLILSTNIVSTDPGPPSLEKNNSQNIPQRPTTAAARVEYKKNIKEHSSMIQESKEHSSIKSIKTPIKTSGKTEIKKKLSLDAEDRQKIKEYAGNLIADSIAYFKQKILSPFKFILDHTDDGIRNDDSGMNTPSFISNDDDGIGNNDSGLTTPIFIRNDDDSVNTPLSFPTPNTPNIPLFTNTPLGTSIDEGDSFLTPNRLRYDVDASMVKRKIIVSDIVNHDFERGNRESNRGYIFGNDCPDISEYKENNAPYINIAKMTQEEDDIEEYENDRDCNKEGESEGQREEESKEESKEQKDKQGEKQSEEQKAQKGLYEQQVGVYQQQIGVPSEHIGVSNGSGDEYKDERYEECEQEEERQEEEEEEGVVEENGEEEGDRDFEDLPRIEKGVFEGEKGIFEGDIETVRPLEVNTDDAPLTERERFNYRHQSAVESPSTVDINNNYQYNDSTYGSVRAIRRLRKDRQDRSDGSGKMTSTTDGNDGNDNNDCNDFYSWSRPISQNPESIGSTVDWMLPSDLNPSSTTFVTNYQNNPSNPSNPYYDTRDTNQLGVYDTATEYPPSGSVPTLEYSPPIEHLEFLAGELLKNVRDAVLTRCKMGKTLVQIYRHFDRDGRGYFDAGDFMTGLSDLRIDCTEKVGALAVSRVAIDSGDRITYCEFHVYVLDPTHSTLYDYILQYMAEQLESRGRRFQLLFRNIFWDIDHLDSSSDRGVLDINIQQRNGLVSTDIFMRSLQCIGLGLNKVDLTRLVRRFDVNNDGACSAVRFVRSIEKSEQWRQSEDIVWGQELVVKEGREEGVVRGKVKENWYLHDSNSMERMEGTNGYGNYNNSNDNNQDNNRNYHDSNTHDTHTHHPIVMSTIADTYNRTRTGPTRNSRPHSADYAIQQGGSNSSNIDMFNSYNFEASEKYDENAKNEDYKYLYSNGHQKSYSGKEGNVYSSLTTLNSEINGVFDTTERFLNNIIDPYDTGGTRNKKNDRELLPRLHPFSDVKMMLVNVPSFYYQSRPMTAGFIPELSLKKNYPIPSNRPGTASRNQLPPYSYGNTYVSTDNKHMTNRSGKAGRVPLGTKNMKPALSVVDRLMIINKN